MHLKQTNKNVAANELDTITSYKQEKKKSHIHSHSDLINITLKT